MAKIKMISGFSFEIPELSESSKIALANSENSIQKNSSTSQQRLKLWDDYTGDEIRAIKKNDRAIYISLYMIKYGFAPKL